MSIFLGGKYIYIKIGVEIGVSKEIEVRIKPVGYRFELRANYKSFVFVCN